MLWTFRSRLKFEDLAAVVNRRYPTQSCPWRKVANGPLIVGETIQLDIIPGTTAEELRDVMQADISIRLIHSQSPRLIWTSALPEC
jgi:hypothetical protein